jgi:hypothetical protein
MRQRAPRCVWTAIISVLFALLLAQGGPGIVVAVDEKGMATVRIGEEEQTVQLPGVKVGDKVVCTVQDSTGKWDCTVHKL